jgi:hypothetical protein
MGALDYIKFIGKVHGNNTNGYQDNTDKSLFYIHDADSNVYTYRLHFMPLGGRPKLKRDVSTLFCGYPLRGVWPHYYTKGV